MLIVTINEIPGKKLEALGVVRGSTVQSRNLGHDLMAGFRTLVGGEVTDYADMLTEARQIAMYLIRKLTNLSLPDIGKEFARDHSTVLYAIRKVEVALKNGDTTMQNNIRDITANINSCL